MTGFHGRRLADGSPSLLRRSPEHEALTCCGDRLHGAEQQPGTPVLGDDTTCGYRGVVMKLLDEIQVRGFRSLRDVSVSGLGSLSSFAGLNNSGKSNLLRALNAFFAGETDPGTPIDVDTDYFRPDLKRKKAKEISVAVHFSLPPSFKFRRDLQPVEELLSGRSFRIEKTWRRHTTQPSIRLNNVQLDLEGRSKINQFLQLISYRYVPNRVLPLDVIRSEQRALRDALVRRVAKRVPSGDQTFAVIRQTAASMIKTLSDRFTRVYPNAQALRLSVPDSWTDLVFAFGYMLQQGDVELEDILQGSGIQSLLMFETLYLIDQDYFQQFGWRQASIWAVEEPESSLHTSLEAQLAEFLAAVAGGPKSRLQVLTTTHSDLVIQYSDCAALVEPTANGSVVTTAAPLDVVRSSARAGVSRWVDPLLYFPLDPVVLVEGKIDRVVIEEVLRLLRSPRRIRVLDLEALQESGKGGVDTLLRYVKDRVAMIRSRSSEAPVHVLLDWDAEGKTGSFNSLFATGDPFSCSAWDATSANPNLGDTVKGIERFYSDRMITFAENSGVSIARTAEGAVVVSSKQLGQLKKVLADLVEAEGLEEEDLAYLRAPIAALVASLCGAPQS